MMGDHRDTHKQDRVAKDGRWPNYYKDLDALPDVTKDVDRQQWNKNGCENITWQHFLLLTRIY